MNRTRREVAHHWLGALQGLDFTEVGAGGASDYAYAGFLQRSEPLPEMTTEQMKEKIKDPLTRWQYWTKLVGFYGN